MKICPLSQKPCNKDCAWYSGVTLECSIVTLAESTEKISRCVAHTPRTKYSNEYYEMNVNPTIYD